MGATRRRREDATPREPARARPLPSLVRERGGAVEKRLARQEEQEPLGGLRRGQEVFGEGVGREDQILDGQAEAAEVAQDIRGHADVLEEPAHGILRL